MSPPDPKAPRDGSPLLLGAGAAVLMVLCCALPVLIAGGALVGLGGVLRRLEVAGRARAKRARNTWSWQGVWAAQASTGQGGSR